jgi:hypothetical protein
MKQFRLRGLVCGLLLAASSTALAIPLSTTGGADELVDYADAQNNADRVQFVADYLMVEASTLSLTTLLSSGGEDGLWQQVGDSTSTLWALDFGFEPAWFLVKTGSGVGVGGDAGPYNTFLYLNNGIGGTLADQFGVIDLGLFTRSRGNIEIQMVSHVGVPEPGTLVLLGSSLLGFGLNGIRRRRSQA